MKGVNLIFIFFLFSALGQNNKKIHWGGGMGWGLNFPVLHQGNKVANVRFQMNPFASFALNLTARKDFNEHWALMGSAEIRSVGFEYVFRPEEYSIIKHRPQPVRHETTVLQFPVLALYKTSLNCMNKRWFLGLGITPGIQEQKIINGLAEDNENGNALSYEIKTYYSSSALCFGKWMIGREKLFKNGNILMWGIEHLFIKQNVATSEINYTFNGKNYHHVFKNNGKYTGIFFRFLFGS